MITVEEAAVDVAVSAKVGKQEAYEIGIEAYHYFYPIVLMEITRRVMTNVPPGVKAGLGPVNTFHHKPAFPSAEDREVVRPNFDTLYSSAWVDLTNDPAVVTLPDTQNRYYLLPMLDMWTDVFAVPGKRTSGTGAQTIVVVPQGWTGALPPGAELIECPTKYFWIIGRTQTNGPKDFAAVNKVQAGMALCPLSQWGKPAPAAKFVPDPSVDMKTDPMTQVHRMGAAQFFELGAELMTLHHPHVTDWSTITRLKRIGIQAGKSFDFESFPQDVQSALESAVADGLKIMREKVPTLAPSVNGWQVDTHTMGVYGNFYLKRAIVAMVGLGANQPEDAIYPMNICDADGDVMTGNKRYVLHFNKEEIPPADAFWSLTMYDAEGFQVANQLNRFAIGDRDDLKYNADGSLDLFIQHDSPGKDRESNWLPAPAKGDLGITLRLYAPKASVINGEWVPPAVRKVK